VTTAKLIDLARYGTRVFCEMQDAKVQKGNLWNALQKMCKKQETTKWHKMH